MMLSVQSEIGNYAILVESGALKKAGSFFDLNRRCLIVSDDGVPAEYLRTLRAQCPQADELVLPQGEAHKNLESLTRILQTLLEHGYTRQDAVIGLGGGVVGDLAGFAASIYLRGVPYYAVPTTLLAQVDSSIGGKTAIDFGGVKNPVGSFYAPTGVLIDPELLRTLAPRQLRAGLAETIKTAVIGDPELFELLERSTDKRLRPADGEPYALKETDLEPILPELIERGLRVKQRFVEADPKEKGPRRLLNFGHTFGHAIEAAAQGELLHGECVALGMLPFCSEALRPRLEALLQRCGLRTRIQTDPERLYSFVKKDKKAFAGGIRAVYAENIGDCREITVTPEEIRVLLSTWYGK